MTAGMRSAVTTSCQISSTVPAVASGRTTGRICRRSGPRTARDAIRGGAVAIRGAAWLSAVMRRTPAEPGPGGASPAIMALLDALAQMAANLVELRALAN